MKKTVLFTLAANFLYSVIFSQIPLPHRTENHKISEFNKRTVELVSLKPLIDLHHIKEIEVIDARPDTLAIGLAQKTSHQPFFLVSDGHFADEAQQFLYHSINLLAPDSLAIVVVIRKFWLTGGLDEEMEKNIRNTGIDTNIEKISSLLARMEFYLKKGQDYLALYRYDTMITRNLFILNDASELIEQVLGSSLNRLVLFDSKFQSYGDNKRKFSWSDIDGHLRKQFEIPILKDSVHVRGVYYSFEEFKNDNPGQRNFEVDKDKLADMIFIRQADGKLMPERDDWGYCDGKNLYVRLKDNYFLLQRQGNAFYIYGSKALTHKKAVYVPGLGAVSNATSGGPQYFTNPVESSTEHLMLKLRPFALDWDNGELN
jgi:hypothetical protein